MTEPLRLLTCIFSYNRAAYLGNTVASWQEFFGAGDLAVVDDGSDEPQTVRLLEALEVDGIRIVRRRARRQPHELHGGLHLLMNDAMELALAEGYELLNFVQDDMQYLWRDPNLLAKVQRIFAAHPDALQVHNAFLKQITKYALLDHDRIELHPESGSYHLRPYGVGDHGFLSLERVRAAGFRFLESETATGRHWREQGHKLYALAAPTLAFIPWPDTVQGSRRIRNWPGLGRGFQQPRQRYYLRPLEAPAVERLLRRPLAELPFLEDYSGPWGWRCLSPFWYTRFASLHDAKQYVRLLGSFWRHGEYMCPRWTRSEGLTDSVAGVR